MHAGGVSGLTVTMPAALAAEAAEAGDPALHVVYINTSLRTKALSHAAVPTITCTSSNVVQTVLQVRALPPASSLPHSFL